MGNSYQPVSASPFIFKRVVMAKRMLQCMADEVARNGALLRITSARGFLERPFAFPSSFAHPLKSKCPIAASRKAFGAQVYAGERSREGKLKEEAS
jgi:hypothetical protein